MSTWRRRLSRRFISTWWDHATYEAEAWRFRARLRCSPVLLDRKIMSGWAYWQTWGHWPPSQEARNHFGRCP